MYRVSNPALVILALLAACGGKVLGGGSGGDQGGGAGGGSTGSGTGSFGSGTGSFGSGTPGSTGSSTGSTGSGTPGSTGTGISATGGGGSNASCGGTVCAPGWVCCNASCGICSPPGGGCIDVACGAAGASGVGGAFIGTGGDPASCVKPSYPPGVVVSDMLSNLETGIAITNVVPGGGWFSFKDQEASSALLPDPANFVTEGPGLHGTRMAVHVLGKGFMPPASATNFGGGVGIALSQAPTDLSAFTGFSFWAKSGSVVSDISVEIGIAETDPGHCDCLSTGNCFAFHSVLFRAVPQAAENQYRVRWADLKQPTYVFNPIPFDPTQVLTIIFASNGPVPYFDYWIDEVVLTK